jgi:FPC/CPF motif-containing protein YcgG
MHSPRMGGMAQACTHRDQALADRFRAFIQDRNFPCVGAKSALGKGNMRIIVGRDLRSAWDDLRIHPALMDIARDYTLDPAPFQSLAVLFVEDPGLDETEFEQHLWQRLQSLSDKDDWLGQPIDPRVSGDPDDPHFSLSFGGEAFFVVGLHPGASRPARRFERPAIIFNLHDQFEQLRASGMYEKMRGTIIERDIALAGEANPMLALHGTISEARQYSGRAVGSEWRCPLRPRKAADRAA